MNNSIMKIKTVLLFVLLTIATCSLAERNAYMFITGATQGLIAGDVTIAGRVDSFEVTETHHLFEQDSAGRKIIHPFIVTTKMSQSMPLLLKAFDTFETLDPVVIRYYRPIPMGGEENYYSILLRNAKIQMIEPIMLDVQDPNVATIPARFRIRFSYTSIEHQYTTSGVTQSYFLTN